MENLGAMHQDVDATQLIGTLEKWLEGVVIRQVDPNTLD